MICLTSEPSLADRDDGGDEHAPNGSLVRTPLTGPCRVTAHTRLTRGWMRRGVEAGEGEGSEDEEARAMMDSKKQATERTDELSLSPFGTEPRESGTE